MTQPATQATKFEIRVVFFFSVWTLISLVHLIKESLENVEVTYNSTCHIKAATCKAELEVQVEVETVDKLCPPGEEGGPPGPWSDWGECSEPCQQGTMTRTRTIPPDSGYSDTETAPCFITCPSAESLRLRVLYDDSFGLPLVT